MPTKDIVCSPGDFTTLRVPVPYNRISIVTATGSISIRDANSNVNSGLVVGDYIDYKQKNPHGVLGVSSTVAETVTIHYGDDEKLVHNTVFVTNPTTNPVNVPPQTMRSFSATPLGPNSSGAFPITAGTQKLDYAFMVINLQGGSGATGQRLDFGLTDGNGQGLDATDIPVYDMTGAQIDTGKVITTKANQTIKISVGGMQQVQISAAAGNTAIVTVSPEATRYAN